MQKYYTDNLISKFIKCLLWDTYVPILAIWKPGDNITKGLTYITKDKYISVAKNSFVSKIYLGDYPNKASIPTDLSDLNFYATVNNQSYYLPSYSEGVIEWNISNKSTVLGPQSGNDPAYFEKKSDYIEGKFYRGVTSNLKSNSSLYDSDTHYYLGQYLRTLRDLKDLDLMPYYNCFSGITSDKIRIADNWKIINDNSNQDGFISYIVPIKYNIDYSIYFNSTVPFKIIPAYYDNYRALNIKTSTSDVEGNIVRSCSNEKPYIFKALNNITNTSSITSKVSEDYLVLIIQVPNTLSSNLVVLEGNFAGKSIDKTFGYNALPKTYTGDVKTLSNKALNEIYKPISSLTRNISSQNYAFNDRLIEYLLLNPIVDNDKVRDNILRIQQYLSSNKARKIFDDNYTYPYKKDIWDTTLRKYIYDLVTSNKGNLSFDINGFVDKDSEEIIDKAKISGGIANV